MQLFSHPILAVLATLCSISAWADPAAVQPGNPAGHEFLVNTTTIGFQVSPAVASGPGGNSVIVWVSQNPGAQSYDVYGQRYDALGKPQGGEFRVSNMSSLYNSMTPVIGMDAKGNFTIAWSSDENSTDTVPIEDIFARQYDVTGNPAGPAFRVNTLHLGYARSPAIAMNLSGNFVITWHNIVEREVFARLYHPDGTPAGRDFQVNSFFEWTQSHPAAAMDAAGNFVVVWQSLNQDDPCDLSLENLSLENLSLENCYGIYGRRFNTFGNAVGSEFQVNTQEVGNQFSPAIAMDLQGNFTVAWASNPLKTSSRLDPCKDSDIFAQRFDSGGNPLGVEFRVNTADAGAQCYPSLAIDTEGNFVVTWDSNDPTLGSGIDVYGQRFDSFGMSLGSEFRVNNLSTFNQNASSVAMDADGDILVAWQSINQTGDYNGTGIVARRYHGLGRTVDLNLRGSDNPDPVTAGSNVSFTFTISNSGTGTAVGLELNTVLPSGTLFYSYKSADWTCRNTLFSVTCTLPELASGLSSSVDIVASTVGLKPKNVETQASVLATQTDLDAADNSVTIVTEVQAAGASPSEVIDEGGSVDDSFRGGGGVLTWWMNATLLMFISAFRRRRIARITNDAIRRPH